MQCLLDFIAYAHSKNIIHRERWGVHCMSMHAMCRASLAMRQPPLPLKDPQLQLSWSSLIPALPASSSGDLKPENILLSDKSPTAAIKVIDFGTSDFCLNGQRLQQKFGTPYYVSGRQCVGERGGTSGLQPEGHVVPIRCPYARAESREEGICTSTWLQHAHGNHEGLTGWQPLHCLRAGLGASMRTQGHGAHRVQAGSEVGARVLAWSCPAGGTRGPEEGL